MKRETKEWVSKAEGDWRVAQRERAADDPVNDAVCFHAQQCAEKYLKALLVENDVVFAKTHDLVFLLGLKREALTGLDSLREALARLSAYAVTFRYPGEEAIGEEAKESMETAGEVRTMVRSHFGLP